MQQKRRGNTVQRERDPAKGTPPHGELAAEVVAGADAREYVDGAHRIVRHQTSEILDVSAAEHLLGRNGPLLFTESSSRHVDTLAVRTGAFAQHNSDLHGLTAFDLHRSFHEDEADDGDKERSGTR